MLRLKPNACIPCIRSIMTTSSSAFYKEFSYLEHLKLEILNTDINKFSSYSVILAFAFLRLGFPSVIGFEVVSVKNFSASWTYFNRIGNAVYEYIITLISIARMFITFSLSEKFLFELRARDNVLANVIYHQWEKIWDNNERKKNRTVYMYLWVNQCIWRVNNFVLDVNIYIFEKTGLF